MAGNKETFKKAYTHVEEGFKKDEEQETIKDGVWEEWISVGDRMAKKVFMVMPFKDTLADEIYAHSTKPICESFGLEIQRADELFTTNPILEDIVAIIEKATIVIVDISGKNPNVFYELGMSHMLKQSQTIMITHDAFGDIPFDIAHFRIIRYENSIVGKATYEEELKKTIESTLQDFKSIYRDEYAFVIQFLSSFDKESDIYELIALSKLPHPPKPDEEFNVAGHNKDTGIRIQSGGASVSFGLTSYVEMGFVEILADKVILTPKGKAFVDVLEDHGYVCDFANGVKFTADLVPTGPLKESSGTP